jgi:hypothetical protein
MKRSEDLTGMQIGNWTVIGRSSTKSKGGKNLWFCKCICGNTIREYVTSVVKKRLPVSCGCIEIRNDLTGQIFGRWTVLEYVGKNKRHISLWRCICSCEKKTERIIEYGQLTSKTSTSCGCYHLELQKKYNKFEIKGDYVVGYTEEGRKFYFDTEDYDRVSQHYWNFYSSDEYPSTSIDRKFVKIYRFIINVKDSKIHVDHINHHEFDNRKINLRKTDKL